MLKSQHFATALGGKFQLQPAQKVSARMYTERFLVRIAHADLVLLASKGRISD
jgi:hypothetical protein